MANDNAPATAEKNGDARELRPVEKFVDFLNRRVETDADDFETAAAQLDRILSAQTLEDMWHADDFESTGGRDLVDVEMRILSFRVRKSDRFTSGIPAGDGKRFYFLVTSARLDNGEEFVWNTGAPLILGKLRWLEAAGLLGKPESEAVIKGTDVADGQVLKLRNVPRRAVASS